MKKCIALLLALILLLSLAGCSEPGTAQTDSAPSQTRQNSPDSGAEPSPQPASDSPETTVPAEPATESPAPELPERFEEITAVDNDQCSVKITGVELDSLWGYTLKLQLENKSDSKTYMFAVDSAAVNGVSWDPFFAVELGPGLKKNGAINFADAEKEALIRSFTDIELVFRIYDSKDWAADDLVRETVHVYPLGQERAERYVRAPQPDDVVLADNDQITVILTGFDQDGFTAERDRLAALGLTGRTLYMDPRERPNTLYELRLGDTLWQVLLVPKTKTVTYSRFNQADKLPGFAPQPTEQPQGAGLKQ